MGKPRERFGRRTADDISGHIVSAAVAGAVELIIHKIPVDGASEVGTNRGKHKKFLVFSYDERLVREAPEGEFNLSDPSSGQIVLIHGFYENRLDSFFAAPVKVGQRGQASKAQGGVSRFEEP